MQNREKKVLLKKKIERIEANWRIETKKEVDLNWKIIQIGILFLRDYIMNLEEVTFEPFDTSYAH